MKKLLTFAFALMSFGATAQNLSFEVKANEATMNISGATGMTAMQFCLQLPAGVTIDTSNTTLGSATDGHTLCVETLDNGDLLFILYSMDLNRFKDGELLRIPININGESTARLYNIRFADTDAVSYAGKETATGIASPKSSPKGKDLKIYNLSGQRMSKPTKGVNIQNGRKVVIK